ncbi:unnamed protein product [Closterium sp. Naga37s-1]|nr:unnamed protein product [Closterium sp. Naga37s-1]
MIVGPCCFFPCLPAHSCMSSFAHSSSSPYSSLAVKYGVKEPCGEVLLFPLGDDKEENERESRLLTGMCHFPPISAVSTCYFLSHPFSFLRLIPPYPYPSPPPPKPPPPAHAPVILSQGDDSSGVCPCARLLCAPITADSLEAFAHTNPLQPKLCALYPAPWYSPLLVLSPLPSATHSHLTLRVCMRVPLLMQLEWGAGMSTSSSREVGCGGSLHAMSHGNKRMAYDPFCHRGSARHCSDFLALPPAIPAILPPSAPRSLRHFPHTSPPTIIPPTQLAPAPSPALRYSLLTQPRPRTLPSLFPLTWQADKEAE